MAVDKVSGSHPFLSGRLQRCDFHLSVLAATSYGLAFDSGFSWAAMFSAALVLRTFVSGEDFHVYGFSASGF